MKRASSGLEFRYGCWNERTSEAELLRAYPTLRAQEIVNAWAYVDAHRDEIERQIAENEET